MRIPYHTSEIFHTTIDVKNLPDTYAQELHLSIKNMILPFLDCGSAMQKIFRMGISRYRFIKRSFSLGANHPDRNGIKHHPVV
jgi:hypothetical protein